MPRSFTIFRHAPQVPEAQPGPFLIGNGLVGVSDLVNVNADHVTDAQNHLIPDYDRLPRVEAWLFSAGAQLTQIEAELGELIRMRHLDLASGVWLDLLGEIVGEPRKGRLDADYRRYIRIRILVNRSKGKLGDFYAIGLLAFTGLDIWVIGYQKAIDFVLLSGPVPVVPEEFVEYLRAAKPAGERIKFLYLYGSEFLTLSGTNFEGGFIGGTNVTGSTVGGLVG